MIDEARRAIAQTPLAWDDVRERRVLAGVEERIAARRRHKTRVRRAVAWAGASVAAAAVFGLAWVGIDASRSSPQVPARLTTVTQPLQDLGAQWSAEEGSTSTVETSPVMAFADGSIARLHDDARIDVDVQTADLVRLEQSAGLVRYEVTPNPARRFVVDAVGVEVRVIGTVFTVDVDDDAVAVAVERGRVAVEGSDRVAELVAGDRLSIDRVPDEIVMLDEEPPDEAQPERGGKSRPARPAAPSKPTPSVQELLERADAARVQGRLGEAAAALSELVRTHRRDPRAYSAYFQLGKVERSRGHHGAAASAFAACYKRAPDGALSEDARAEAAVSWRDAGQTERARSTAQEYLKRHPKGAHAARMQRILRRAQ